MATAIAPRNDMYLSVLAGRAITALADLASDSPVWNDRIDSDLRSGIAYCEALRSHGGKALRNSASEGWNALKRSVQDTPDAGSSSIDITAESGKVERFLSQLVASRQVPEISELVAAIEFLRKTATDR
jgi:hypothetical protein